MDMMVTVTMWNNMLLIPGNVSERSVLIRRKKVSDWSIGTSAG